VQLPEGGGRALTLGRLTEHLAEQSQPGRGTQSKLSKLCQERGQQQSTEDGQGKDERQRGDSLEGTPRRNLVVLNRGTPHARVTISNVALRVRADGPFSEARVPDSKHLALEQTTLTFSRTQSRDGGPGLRIEVRNQDAEPGAGSEGPSSLSSWSPMCISESELLLLLNRRPDIQRQWQEEQGGEQVAEVLQSIARWMTMQFGEHDMDAPASPSSSAPVVFAVVSSQSGRNSQSPQMWRGLVIEQPLYRMGLRRAGIGYLIQIKATTTPEVGLLLSGLQIDYKTHRHGTLFLSRGTLVDFDPQATNIWGSRHGCNRDYVSRVFQNLIHGLEISVGVKGNLVLELEDQE